MNHGISRRYTINWNQIILDLIIFFYEDTMVIENINFPTYDSSYNNIPGTIKRGKYKVSTLIYWTLIVGYTKECCRT